MTQPKPPVFILGLHRSGTTVLYEMLAAAGIWNTLSAWHVIAFDEIVCPETEIEQSQEQLEQKFSELGLHTRGVDVVNLSPATMEEYGFILDNHGYGFALRSKNLPFFDHVCQTVQRTHTLDLPLLLKNPWDFPHPRRIKSLIPSARFVCIHRNPLHVFSSMWRFTKRSIEDPMPYVAMLSRRYARLISSPWKMTGLRFGLKHGADAYMRWLIRSCASRCDKHLREIAKVPDCDRIDIRYEDLCARPRATIHGILHHFDLPIHDADYEGMIGVRKSSVDAVVAKQRKLIEKRMQAYLDSVGLEFEEPSGV